MANQYRERVEFSQGGYERIARSRGRQNDAIHAVSDQHIYCKVELVIGWRRGQQNRVAALRCSIAHG